jgi:uncharacterized protein
MGKLLSWLAIAFAIYVAYKIVMALQRKAQLRQSAAPEADPKDASRKPKGAEAGQLTTLIACAHCGLQLPKDEAVRVNESFFCGEPHARLGVKKSGEA